MAEPSVRPTFGKLHCRYLDDWNRFNYFSCCILQWGTLLANLIAFAFSMAAAWLVFALRDSFADVAIIGVVLNYAFLLPYFLGIFAMFCMFLANGATSVERVLEYATSALPQEPPWELPSDPPPSQWPREGSLEFDGVSLRYRAGLPLAVKDVSFRLRPAEHVGIVGRTGAGKSSLLVLLFRIVDASGGSIRTTSTSTRSVSTRSAARSPCCHRHPSSCRAASRTTWTPSAA